jgi:type II secretory pathway pseudopilin PulG
MFGRSMRFPASISAAAGFSLVELAVGCTLLGLLALVCVQSLQGILPAVRVDAAIREVATMLEWSRWSAVRDGRAFRVVIDSEEPVLTVFREPGDLAAEEPLVAVRRLDLRESHSSVVFGTADGVHRTSGCEFVNPSGIHLQDHTLRFLPSGTTDRCGSLYLIPEQDVPNRRDRMRALSVLLTTGRLQTWTYDPLAESECAEDGTWKPL